MTPSRNKTLIILCISALDLLAACGVHKKSDKLAQPQTGLQPGYYRATEGDSEVLPLVAVTGQGDSMKVYSFLTHACGDGAAAVTVTKPAAKAASYGAKGQVPSLRGSLCHAAEGQGTAAYESFGINYVSDRKQGIDVEIQ